MKSDYDSTSLVRTLGLASSLSFLLPRFNDEGSQKWLLSQHLVSKGGGESKK